ERTRQLHVATRVRSARWLNWYCFGWRPGLKILIGCLRGEELEGFAVFRPRVVGGGLYWECLDLWCDPAVSYCGDLLFSFALAENGREGGRGVITHDYPAVRGWLDRRLWKRVVHEDPGGFMTGRKALMRRIREGATYFTLGEGDQGM
ncbi:MAG: hypothetical protein HQM00_01130, partial [Magnetococcales bacterium]|nr:hypothetical protein [Magnetococcales bacterium]